MKTNYKFSHRVLSWVLALAMVLSLFPLQVLITKSSAASVNGMDLVADKSTMDAWKDLFPIDNPSTENSGKVWLDKSVVAGNMTFGTGAAQTEISRDKVQSFLVALSAMASTKSITGSSYAPTDTMLVLDVSGSMGSGQSGNRMADDMVDAANDSIKSLLEANKYNRVGVVLYSGPTTVNGAASENDAVLLLPLGRYTANDDGEYLSYSNNNSGEKVSLASGMKDEVTGKAPTAVSKDVKGGTYIQKGVILAMNQFTATSNTTTVTDPTLGTLKRKPILVLMSDGSPTVASTDFTNPDEIHLGTGQEKYATAGLAFITQLSAAYAKAKIEEKYGENSCLFYTLGLGIAGKTFAMSVLDPSSSGASTAVNDYWTTYEKDDTVTVKVGSKTVENPAYKEWNDKYGKEWSWNRPQAPEQYIDQDINVTKISTALEHYYVDKYFAADNSDSLQNAFKDIVASIQLQSSYFPTLIEESEELSGYISFVDCIGRYMEVVDIKGILIHNTLFSGAEMAKAIATGGLGTTNAPTEVGNEFVWSVQKRLGLELEEARSLIANAYRAGQLSWTDLNHYSNYIGWIAAEDQSYLGFYEDGKTDLSQFPNAVYTVKSYSYLGEVDEEHGVSKTDMMYATVRVMTNIQTGDVTVAFAVPAALVPVVNYQVTLDKNQNVEKLEATGAKEPIRLIYEAALREDINAFNVKEIVSGEYLKEDGSVSDGKISFFTNRWDRDNTIEWDNLNTYGYFNPAKQNEHYYYQENCKIYSNKSGTLYKGEAQPSGTMYRAYTVYSKTGSTVKQEVKYYPIAAEYLKDAVRDTDGSWHIPAGKIRINVDPPRDKENNSNPSGTLDWSAVPFVHANESDTIGKSYYVGATLGNNGRVTIQPETGIKLTKTMANGVAAPSEAFTFNLKNTTNATDNNTYPAMWLRSDGSWENTQVTFANGKAPVAIKAGETLYIGGMTDGDIIEVREEETVDYIASANGLATTNTVTVKKNELANVSFVNDKRGTGEVTIGKRVEHKLGDDYEIPADKVFTMQVTLTGVGTANQTFTIEKMDGQEGTVSTDSNGVFEVTLKDNEQVKILGLPTGTKVTVVEKNIPNGFTATYWDNGVEGNGIVTIEKGNMSSVVVSNAYVPAQVSPVNLLLSGKKVVKQTNGIEITDWLNTYTFTFILERNVNGAWQPVSTVTVNETNHTYAFDMSGEVYEAPGVYAYQVRELIPEESNRISAMSYDRTVHTFSVHVGDANMDGKLEIVKVTNTLTQEDFQKNSNDQYVITADFENTQEVSEFAWASINIQKKITDHSSSAPGLSGFTFGLYDEKGHEITVNHNGIKAILAAPSDDIGEAMINIQFSASGVYTFYVKEKQPTVGINGMTYSDEAVKVLVTVTETSGKLHATVTYPDASNNRVTITNSYKAKETELAIDFVSKVLSGRDMKAGEFTFAVKDLNGNVLLRGTNDASGKVTFDNTLKFAKADHYYYNIVETSTDGKGVTVDTNTYRIDVMVADVNGELKATYEVNNTPGYKVEFKNTYKAKPVTNVIQGSKTLEGKKLINDEFTFILKEYSVDGQLVSIPNTWTTKNYIDGGFQFPAISYDQPGTYVYTVTEYKPAGQLLGITYDESTFTVTVKVKDNGEGALVIESQTITKGTSQVDELRFVNKYEPEKTTEQISGNKNLTGKVDNNLKGGEYKFDLYQANENWVKGQKIQTVANGAGGNITFTAIDYTRAGNYYYLVSEVNGGQCINGVTYDDEVYRVWVEVKDNGMGNLLSTVHIYHADGVPASEIKFVNEYKVTGDATVVLSGKKFLEGRDLTTNDSFTFALYDTDGSFRPDTKIASAQMGADGKFSFTLKYQPKDVGKSFDYLLVEEKAGQTIDGVTYSTKEYHITVKVSDNGKGGISTEVTVEGATASALDFTNTYKASKTSVQLSGKKELTGMTLTDNAFQFEMYQVGDDGTIGKLLQTKGNVGGTFTFDKIEYEAAGTYIYQVVEKNGGSTIKGITYDATRYTVVVTVTDNGAGKLVAQTDITKAMEGSKEIIPVQQMQFVNAYHITGTDDVILSGKKGMDGRDLTAADQFTFQLFKADENFVKSGTPIKSAVADHETGLFEIKLTYGPQDAGKIYYYVLLEKNAGTTIDGVTYSDKEYHLTVRVTDNGAGGVTASATVAGDTSLNGLNFTNKYQSQAAEKVFTGSKILEGIRQLKENDFLFDLYKATENFTIDGNAIQSVPNGANGSFQFDAVKLNTAGVYYFVIKENSQSPIGGVSYDAAMYRITVTVEDNGKGQLVVKNTEMTRVLGTESAKAEKIVFTNHYDAASATVSLTGKKILNGRDLLSGEFNFLLYAANESFAVAEGTAPMMAVNKADGSFTFDALTFTEAKTYYFVIREDQTVKADRVTFDDTVYHVSIQVKDDENGKLVASAPKITKVGSDKAVDEVVFTNVYTPKPADITVDIQVEKTVENKGTEKIGPENFQFLLKALDAKDGITVKSGKDGKAVFTLTFSEDDIGKVYHYQLTEVNDGRANVSYSTASYQITITISLGEDNSLVAEVKQGETVVQQAVAAFENVYDYTPKQEHPDDDPPKTGDEMALSLYLTMMGIACGAAIMLIRYDNKKKVR